MKVARLNEVESRAASEAGARGVHLRVLMGRDVGAPTFVMRHFEIEAGGHTPYHTHPWEHEVFVVAGRGLVRRKDGESPLAAGTFVYVAPGEEHAFVAAGDEALSFLCVVPAGRYPGQ